MNWSRESDTNLISDDGRYSIARVNIGAMLMYEAWVKTSGRDWDMLTVRSCQESDNARRECIAALKQLCEDHHGNADRPKDTPSV